ncbi:FAD-dependent oxidoreductase [Streptomyces monashensis]|uniref:FAD-binding domain-containing protein n=1 Tax=Streptomyces monashensis TaxID=1678012 RepID=A0A1S2PG07_9ACTN|nr:FAD-dependent oxidoreductase [Streptomyces monashensis]OIJ92643.1 hypothetical protein BIV23_38515 [Streptomyces monashensis]
MSADVIVSGAGPVGLLTAALLDSAGVKVEVLERLTERSTNSRAAVMHPRTLEVLPTVRTGYGRRLTDILLSYGRAVPRTHFGMLPQLLDYSELDTPYPHILQITQATTERVLASLVEARGIPVHYGQEVTGFERDDTVVRVQGGDTVRTARYLVGAAGAWSPVRQQAGIEFPGTPGSTVSFLADAELDAAPQNATHVWDHETGWVGVVPLFDGIHRVFGVLPEDTGLTPEQVTARRSRPLTLEDLRGILKRVAGTDYGLRNAVWISTAGNTIRHATRYRANRVLVAGDAAHVHFPAGDQGVNVGMQDAVNLAWKLAAEVKGRATPLITGGAASYDRERRPVAESLAQNTQAQTALTTTFTPQGSALRELMSTLLTRPEANARLAGLLSGLSVSYTPPMRATRWTGPAHQT